MTGANIAKNPEETPAQKAMKASNELNAARGIANSIKIAENAPDVIDTSVLPKVPISDLARAGGKLNAYANQAVPTEVAEYQKNVEAPRLNAPINVPAASTPPVIPNSVTRPSEALATKTAADSATELAAAPPNKVSAVIEKLKQEEKKGGPNLFDILEAAAAGWQGNTPLYVQKKMQKAQQEGEKEKMAEAAALQGQELQRRFEEERAQRAAEMAQDRELRLAEIASAEKRAGLLSPSLGTSRLKLDELGLGK